MFGCEHFGAPGPHLDYSFHVPFLGGCRLRVPWFTPLLFGVICGVSHVLSSVRDPAMPRGEAHWEYLQEYFQPRVQILELLKNHPSQSGKDRDS